MQLNSSRNELMQALDKVRGVVERARVRDSENDITSHFLLEVTSDGLEITGTDLTILARARLDVRNAKKGICTADAETLCSVVSALRDGADVSLRLEDNELHLTSGQTHYSLPSLDAKGFPRFSQDFEADAAVSFSMPAARFKHLFDKTLFCAAVRENRYYLNGVYLHVDGKKLVAAATDGLRLATCRTALPKGAAKLKGIILPRKAVTELTRILEAGGDKDKDEGEELEIGIEADDSLARFRFAEIEFTTKLVDGAYPDYQRVIPKKKIASLGAETNLLGDIVKRAQVVTDDGQSSLVRFALENKLLTVTSGTPARGTFQDTLDVRFEGEPFEIAFNGKQLREILQHTPGDEDPGTSALTIDLQDPTAPILLREDGDDDRAYVLMPLRI